MPDHYVWLRHAPFVDSGTPDLTIELTPEEPGEYDFACQMGMLRGKLVAE